MKKELTAQQQSIIVFLLHSFTNFAFLCVPLKGVSKRILCVNALIAGVRPAHSHTAFST
jgi:hypothetical protein